MEALKLPHDEPAAGRLGELEYLRETCAELRHRVEHRSDLHLDAAHLLGTPLSALHDLLGILEEELTGPLTAAQRELVHTARTSVCQLRAQIDDLFDALAFEFGSKLLQRQRLGLDTLLGDALREVHRLPHLRHVDLRTILHPDLPELFCDRTQMRLALTGLIRSAAGSLRHDGHVTVLACPHGSADPGTPPPQVLIAINDSGPSDPRHAEARLRRSRSEDEESLCAGHGLAIGLCREIIERHGGHVLATSPPGEGATCCFTLPVGDPEQEEA